LKKIKREKIEQYYFGSFFTNLILKFDSVPVGAGLILTVLDAKTGSRLSEIARREVKYGISKYYTQENVENIREFLIIYCVKKAIYLNKKNYKRIDYEKMVYCTFNELYNNIINILETFNIKNVIRLPNSNDVWMKVTKGKSLDENRNKNKVSYVPK